MNDLLIVFQHNVVAALLGLFSTLVACSIVYRVLQGTPPPTPVIPWRDYQTISSASANIGFPATSFVVESVLIPDSSRPGEFREVAEPRPPVGGWPNHCAYCGVADAPEAGCCVHCGAPWEK